MNTRDLARVFGMYSFRCGREIDLQAGVELALAGLGTPYEREYRFDRRNRIDFWLPEPGIGIEIKIQGSVTDVLLQLSRYAAFPQVHGLVLLTTRRTHLQIRENTVEGKPLEIVLARGLGL